MGEIVIFGAGGRTGRAAVAEAVRRGHRVTAVVRNPDAYRELAGEGVRVVAGDVTDADAVAERAAGHDAAIAAVHDPGAQAEAFFTAAARALLDGLERAGVRRLVTVGLAANLELAPGVPLMDAPGFPPEFRAFSLAHAAGTAVLRAADTTTVDWLVVSPAGDFDHTGTPGGRWTAATGDFAARVTPADLALVLLDEIDSPRHHRTHLGVAGA
ncbi:NAD(P)-dependent oxidoreductase [Kitasatospora sp. NPDC092948]|uniref:NAD(P)-dependent oxidoreductase n=1 Tax=Kitasatospora sp. NPDC092948 TaxID=3364088 RepID=UPI0038006EC9